MAGEFTRTTIGSLLERDGGSVKTGPFGTTLKAHEYSTDGVPLISVGEVGYGSLVVRESTPRAPAEVVERLPEYVLQAGDIVFGRKGAVDRSAFVKAEQAGWFLGSDGIRLRLPGSCDARFIGYQLQSSGVRSWLLQHATGTTMASLNQNTIERVPIVLPPLPVQNAIAHILGTLDDKIELNRRMNETLEQIAQALFKSWFVDFDPVRAKAEGCDPGLSSEIADLFPDSFEESEVGEIPKGWHAGPLGAFFTVGLGGAWGDERPSVKATVAVRCLRGIDCHDLAEGRVPDVPSRWLSTNQTVKRHLVDGAVIVEGSGSFCGRSLLWHSTYGELIGEPVVYSNFCKRLDPICTASQAVGCWLYMRKAYREGELQAFRTGTAFPNFDIHGALANLYVVVPPTELADVFAGLFRSSQRLDLLAQNRTLAALRDALLPKLISGDIRLKDMERIIEGTRF